MGKRTTVSLPPELAACHDRLPTNYRRYLLRLLRLCPPQHAPPYELRRPGIQPVVRPIDRPDEDTTQYLLGRWPTLSAAWSDALRCYGQPLLDNNLRLSGEDMDLMDTLWPTP